MIKRIAKILVAIFVFIALCFGVFYIYASDYYRADEECISTFLPGSSIEECELSDGSFAYIPTDYTTGVVFYPGGKVEHTAYEPLMRAMAERGILAILIKMPFNLAVFDQNAADGIQEQFPEVEHWYMAGHSLGGSMAASYISKNSDTYDGLILLAAYSTADLSESGVEVASIYGSLDCVMNKEKYAEYFCNLPSSLEETVIEGANHAGFGMYGEQKGDGVATITNAEQIEITADIIADFVK
jgi:hypothetical protein